MDWRHSCLDVESQFVKKNRRKKKRKTFHDEFHDETSLEGIAQENAETMFRNTVVFIAMDSIINDLDTQFNTTAEIADIFAAILILFGILQRMKSNLCASHYQEIFQRSYPSL